MPAQFWARIRAHGALPAACAALTLAVLGPVLRPGFVLVYDMVFAPRQSVLPASVGLGPALPRSAPADAVVAVLTHVVPGDLLQKGILVGTLFAAALGAGRLVPTASTPVRLVAASVYAWNAYVAERLFIGHWPLLLGYASLPWAAAAGLALRRGEPRAWARLVLTSVPAVLNPTGGLLAAGAGIAAAGRRRAPVAVAVAVVLNAPWWVPSLLHPGSSGADPLGAALFRVRGEGGSPAPLSLLGLGGIWNADVVPTSRTSPLVGFIGVLFALAAVAGLRPLARRWGVAATASLAGLAVGGLVLALAGTVLPATAMRWVGFGLLRDGQKWVAWWALLVALGAGLAVERLSRKAVVAAVLPVALLPDLAWGGAGRLEPVEYPHDWTVVRETLSRDRHPGDVLVLPLSTYRRFSWNDDRTQLDPAPRALPRTTVTDDTLPVDGVVVRGEDARVDEVKSALAAAQPLGPLGIGWVLVEHGTPGPAVDTRGLSLVYVGRWLSLYEVPNPAKVDNGPPAAPVFAAIAFALTVIAVALGFRLSPRRAKE
jgi:hypothetical protein